MFKINNKDTRATPFATTPLVNFEHVIARWVTFNIAGCSTL